MNAVLDTSFIVGYYDADAPEQERAERWYLASDDDFLTTPLAVAEMDYRDRPEIGLVDASLVALGHRLRTDRIATFDEGHFRTLTTRAGKPFAILPADAGKD